MTCIQGAESVGARRGVGRDGRVVPSLRRVEGGGTCWGVGGGHGCSMGERGKDKSFVIFM